MSSVASHGKRKEPAVANHSGKVLRWTEGSCRHLATLRSSCSSVLYRENLSILKYFLWPHLPDWYVKYITGISLHLSYQVTLRKRATVCSGSSHTYICKQNHKIAMFHIHISCKAVFNYSKVKKKKTDNHSFPKELGSKELHKSTCVNGKSNDP